MNDYGYGLWALVVINTVVLVVFVNPPGDSGDFIS